MKTYDAYLGLGSNVGEREQYLRTAVDALKAVDGIKTVWVSSVYETDPFGNVQQQKFLNAVLQIETSLVPEELLPILKSIEVSVGRRATERWGPREIDIDILLYDGLVRQTDAVRVPHAGLELRKFVLVPFAEIAPDVVHPVNGMTITELLHECKDDGRVVRTAHKIIL